MPADQRPVGDVALTRRQVVRTGLTAPALLALSGCALRVGQPDADPTMPAPGPDELARERVAAQADALAESAGATARLRPDDARQLTLIAGQHRAHAAALRPVPAAGGGQATSTPTSRPAPTPGVSSGGATKRTALGRQALAEQQGATAVEAELGQVSPDVARLLASVAACRTVHADVLKRLARGESA